MSSVQAIDMKASILTKTKSNIFFKGGGGDNIFKFYKILILIGISNRLRVYIFIKIIIMRVIMGYRARILLLRMI